eukprot:2261983-Prymnesium_polylepis.2
MGRIHTHKWWNLHLVGCVATHKHTLACVVQAFSLPLPLPPSAQHLRRSSRALRVSHMINRSEPPPSLPSWRPRECAARAAAAAAAPAPR